MTRPAGAGPRRTTPAASTSYNSASRMHQLSPTFANLERKLNRHVAAFARALEFDLAGRALAMTDCWVNIMPRQVVHCLPPAPVIDDQRHVLREDAAGQSGAEVRRSAARTLHGGAAAHCHGSSAESAVDRPAGGGGECGAIRKLGCATRCAESRRGGACQHQFQLQLVLAAKKSPACDDRRGSPEMRR